jgi:hypothetical protein
MLTKCEIHVKVCPSASILKALMSPRQVRLSTVTNPQLSSNSFPKMITKLSE